MYGGGYIFEESKNGYSESEDKNRLDHFESKIAAGDKIEPSDWMPAEYRKQLIRMIEQ
ncbi:MAG TPA: 1,2-phenylacetyl-CoA epoxidase subunit A, partial [Ignavibacteria bacterium]|nr:1,2-phenylacetyl-CoA epoxidase subunit A [Ignavibacteria bacterium]